jgi:8-oxo-dGTP diphosphatase
MKIGVEAFILKNEKLLLGLRKNAYGEGSWGLPGGHIERKESLSNGLKRELFEELGVEVKSMFLKVTNLQIQPKKIGGSYIHFGFQIIIKNKDIKQIALKNTKEPHKCQEWKFFDINKLNETNIFFGHQEEIRAYLKNRFFIFSIKKHEK